MLLLFDDFGQDEDADQRGHGTESKDVQHNVYFIKYDALGGTKNTNFRNSMGALSNPISFAISRGGTNLKLLITRHFQVQFYI